jgi:hypothetical protein
VRLLHELAKIHATFDDPHLVSRAGLVPVMALAQRAERVVESLVRIGHRHLPRCTSSGLPEKMATLPWPCRRSSPFMPELAKTPRLLRARSDGNPAH